MPGIICAIRGGPQSHATIRTAIQLARQHQATIYFLYVVNLDFMTHTTSSRIQAISEDMQQMGEFILLTAVERASRKKVNAEMLIRHGKVGDEIIEASRSVQADYVVLGRPKASTDVDYFDADRLQQFANYIEEVTRAKVIFAEEEQL